jgi:hypothetical protein
MQPQRERAATAPSGKTGRRQGWWRPADPAISPPARYGRRLERKRIARFAAAHRVRRQTAHRGERSEQLSVLTSVRVPGRVVRRGRSRTGARADDASRTEPAHRPLPLHCARALRRVHRREARRCLRRRNPDAKRSIPTRISGPSARAHLATRSASPRRTGGNRRAPVR